jgi:hypothetical protein
VRAIIWRMPQGWQAFARDMQEVAMKLTQLVPAALALALTLLVVALVPAPTADLSQGEQVAIYATAVRHLVAQSRSTWPVVFVEPRLVARVKPAEPPADGGPVPAGLVEALQGLAPRVELASADEAINRDPNQPGWGMATRDGGILVTLGPIQPQPDGTVVLGAQWHVHAVNAGCYEYRLRRAGGVWIVVEAALRWLS